ncbi:MAG: exodeoxyribonuclease VII small subunit [Chloroflexota bacterium]
MPDISDMTFEKAYAELAHIIEQMESGDLPLEKSVETYERGRLLATHCEILLEQAELRISTLDAPGDG